jgi:hypothetical protein
MRSLIGLTLSFSLLVPGVTARQTDDSQPSSAAQATAQTSDRSAIDAVLKRYEAAYDHQNLDELLAVWPSLRNDKKGLRKIKDEFGRADVSEMNVSLQVREVQAAADGETLVRCARSEQYKKVQTTSYDRMIGVPSQTSNPSQDKRTVHKTSDVWLTLHPGTTWTITTVNDKKPR